MVTIEQQLKDCRGMAEYPLYVKALIKRQRGPCISTFRWKSRSTQRWQSISRCLMPS